MFGGLAFMVNTHMACDIVKDDLMVRVGKAGYEAALARGAREMNFTCSPMRGMVMVPRTEVSTESDLDPWIALAVEFAQTEPPKVGQEELTQPCTRRRNPFTLAGWSGPGVSTPGDPV